jgi:folate-binding protein YgfZ
MTGPHIALLADRGVVSVTGPDAAKLLQGVVTNDMDLLASQPSLFAGLLSPQGKILFDFFVVKTAAGLLVDVAREQAGDLVKRLTLYKLRAKVEIANISEAHAVTASWHGEETPAAIGYADPRLPELGQRQIVALGEVDEPLHGMKEAAAYHAHRIALGVPEGGKDYAFGDTFPHEALFDQLNGVSFDKGCYVGQEVVSRMQHRGTARKRVVPVVAGSPLPARGTEVTAGGQPIGTLGSCAGSRGLALLRLDRAAEMKEKGFGLTAGDTPVAIELPAWATFPLVPEKTAT